MKPLQNTTEGHMTFQAKYLRFRIYIRRGQRNISKPYLAIVLLEQLRQHMHIVVVFII
mgnify:CR=1 FL=1